MKTTYEEDRTSINVTKETKERLRRLGEKDESYNEIVSSLIDATQKGYDDEKVGQRPKARRGE
jgi:hypothetical protein